MHKKGLFCPYEPSHILLAHRMQTHLVKCRKQHKNKMVQCLNNATHIVPEPELAFHMETCSDRISIDKFMYASSTTAEERFPVPTLNLAPAEKWDDDFHPTYDPEEHCINNPITRNKNNLPRAERRQFRMEERQRLQKFEVNKADETPKELPKKPNSTQVRRPVTVSAGVFNTAVDEEEDDVSTLMEKIKLGSKTVTIPKVQPATTSPEQDVNGTKQMEGAFTTVQRAKKKSRTWAWIGTDIMNMFCFTF